MVGLQPEFCPDGPPPLKSPAVYFFIFRSLSLSLKHITVAGLLFPFPVQLGFKIPWDFFFWNGGGGVFLVSQLKSLLNSHTPEFKNANSVTGHSP